MKHFVAGSGGRLVYSEDFLNLQDLALSVQSIFEGCDNFVISGCVVTGSNISAGYVWLNGHVRYFSGASGFQYPYYIHESNSYTSTEYKDEPNKTGCVNYLCAGASSVPIINDEVTGAPPAAITITSVYTPRIQDKFFGKYALALNTPSAKQTVNKDVDFTGNITATQDIASLQSLSVVNKTAGSIIKGYFKPNGDASVGLWLNNILATDIVMTTGGVIKFFKGGTEIASFSDSAVTFNKDLYAPRLCTSSISLSADQIYNHTDTSDTGAITINKTGLNNSTTKFRDFVVCDGKNTTVLYLDGKNKKMQADVSLEIKHTGSGLTVTNKSKNKTDAGLVNAIYLKAQDGLMGQIGYTDAMSSAFLIASQTGDITLAPKESVNVAGGLKINGVNISSVYVNQTAYDKEMSGKVDKVNGMGLSQESFTSEHKQKLNSIKFADTVANTDGLVNLYFVQNLVGNCLGKTQNLSDILDKVGARSNLDVYSTQEIDAKLKAKLDKADAYQGEVFTTLLKNKLDGIVAGRFEGTDSEGQLVPKVNGYISTNQILTELSKYAPKMLNTYSVSEKAQVAANLNIYTKTESDSKYMVASNLMDDYITYLTATQKSTTDEAKFILREKISAASIESLGDYVTRKGLLSDLELKDDTAKKNVCNKLGAAYASDYQLKIQDTGWVPLSVGGLYARQIGSVVCIQGSFTISAQSSSLLFELPNQIQSPSYAVEYSRPQGGDYEKSRKFIAKIDGGSRRCMVVHNSINGENAAFTLTYMV